MITMDFRNLTRYVKSFYLRFQNFQEKYMLKPIKAYDVERQLTITGEKNSLTIKEPSKNHTHSCFFSKIRERKLCGQAFDNPLRLLHQLRLSGSNSCSHRKQNGRKSSLTMIKNFNQNHAHIFAQPSTNQRAVSRNLFSFSGCGWMLSYHLGVAQTLLDAKKITSQTRFAGASGGALAAAVLACGLCPTDTLQLFQEQAAHCHATGTWWKLKKLLLNMLENTLPHNAHIMCSGRVTVALTRVWPQPRWRPILVRYFVSRQELISALVASCMVPGYLDFALVDRFRNMYVIDGGLLHLVPHIAGAVKISPFKSFFLRSQKTHLDISPALTPSFPYSDNQLWSLCFYPSSSDVTENIFHWGQVATAEWLNALPSAASFNPE